MNMQNIILKYPSRLVCENEAIIFRGGSCLEFNLLNWVTFPTTNIRVNGKHYLLSNYARPCRYI